MSPMIIPVAIVAIGADCLGAIGLFAYFFDASPNHRGDSDLLWGAISFGFFGIVLTCIALDMAGVTL
jgi:hypothetical protein